MTLDFLLSLHYVVVDASNPDSVICPLPLSYDEALSLAAELSADTGLTFIVVDLDEVE